VKKQENVEKGERNEIKKGKWRQNNWTMYILRTSNLSVWFDFAWAQKSDFENRFWKRKNSNGMTSNVWADTVRLHNFEKRQLEMRCGIPNTRTMQKAVKFEKSCAGSRDRAMRYTANFMNFLRTGHGSDQISDCSASVT
jgi:hypothetical protein